VSHENIDFAKMLQLTGVRHSAAYFIMRVRQHTEQHENSFNLRTSVTGGLVARSKLGCTHGF